MISNLIQFAIQFILLALIITYYSLKGVDFKFDLTLLLIPVMLVILAGPWTGLWDFDFITDHQIQGSETARGVWGAIVDVHYARNFSVTECKRQVPGIFSLESLNRNCRNLQNNFVGRGAAKLLLFGVIARYSCCCCWRSAYCCSTALNVTLWIMCR